MNITFVRPIMLILDLGHKIPARWTERTDQQTDGGGGVGARRRFNVIGALPRGCQ